MNPVPDNILRIFKAGGVDYVRGKTVYSPVNISHAVTEPDQGAAVVHGVKTVRGKVVPFRKKPLRSHPYGNSRSPGSKAAGDRKRPFPPVLPSLSCEK